MAKRVRKSTSVIVLALSHDQGQPELDFWDGQAGGTPGIRILRKINSDLAKWIRREYSAKVYGLPYQAAMKGIFLKDAAVLAGLGIIGKNNLVITPQYGPRVRFGALLVDLPLRCTEPLGAFAPCDDCAEPCKKACPRKAFQDNSYQGKRCLIQMRRDEASKIVQKQPTPWLPVRCLIAYCRRCELSCPVGS
jgi:epoxyqueuosine reductase